MVSVWAHWRKIKFEFSTPTSVAWFLGLSKYSPNILEASARSQLTGPLSHQPAAGLHWSKEGHGAEEGGAPPDGIPGSSFGPVAHHLSEQS
jgi:hypothetical protein